MTLHGSVSRKGDGALKALLLHFTGYLVGLLHVALVDEAVSVASAGAEELRPAAAAAFLAVDVYLREIGLDIVVECSVIKVAHFPLLYSNELVAGVDIAVRLHRNVVVAAAAAAQALYRAGTGVEVHHEVEEVELVLGAVRHDVAQLVVLGEYAGEILLVDGVGHRGVGNHRLSGKLNESQVAHCEDIVGEIEIILCEGRADVVVLGSAVLNQLLELRHDDVEAALAVYGLSDTVGDLAAAVEGEHAVAHLAVDVVYLLIVEQDTVGGYREAEALAVLLLDGARVFNGLYYRIPRHERLAAEEVKLELLAVGGALDKEVDSLLAGLGGHNAALAAEVALLREAVLAAEVAVVGNVQAHGLYRGLDHCVAVLFVVVLGEERAVPVELVKLGVALAHFVFEVLRKLCGEVSGHFLGHGGVNEVEHVVRAVVGEVDSAAVDVEHYVVAELFELVYHRNFAFLCKYLSVR